MASGRRPGRPDEELFLQGQGTPTPDSPTIGPLRINKANSASPPPRSGSAGAHQYPTPSQPLSSAKPPYPDDGPRQPASLFRQTSPGAERVGTPERAEEGRSGQPRSATRARFDANDPNRPTISGYNQPPAASRLAERRRTSAKSLPDSPGPETPEKDDNLFQRAPQRGGTPQQGAILAGAGSSSQPGAGEAYYPPPIGAAAPASNTLHIPSPAGINRLSSTASTSTTRAQRGSPPPPETPATDHPNGAFDTRYAAASNATSASLAAQTGAAAQRANKYASSTARPGASTSQQAQQQQSPPRRPWTPTERGASPHGPLMSYRGMDEVPATSSARNPIAGVSAPTPLPYQVPPQSAPGHQQLFQPAELQRLNIHEEPPPAYSSVPAPAGGTAPGSVTAQGYPDEKRSGSVPAPLPVSNHGSPGPAGMQDPNLHRHPAFANDVPMQPQTQPQGAAVPQHSTSTMVPIQVQPTPSSQPGAGPASPPPLPEGWIAHLDSNSGQYYYIHLPTQSTQWEFPKGPTPLNFQEPLSPTGTFVNPLASPALSSFQQPLASPGFPVQHAQYRESMLSMASVATPTAGAFTGPPPSAGVDMYKISPTNGVYFGPYLRYTNMDLERGLWLGSILLVTDVPQPPTIHIHQSADLSPNPRQLKANPIYSHQRYLFYRYDVDLVMEDQGTKWTYAITSHLGCTRYEFLVAGRYETSWRFIAHSGNDFALSVNANERSKLGGIGLMWRDILQKHLETGGFHAQLGLGGQIYADRLWKEIPALKQWTAMSGKENRKNAPWTPRHEDDVTHSFFHYYTSHFDQPHLREAFAQIPHILTLDDHDIFDGFGSYPEYMQSSNMFKNIGRIGIEMYLLFQHHTTHEILRNVSADLDLFTITGSGWHFVKYLGPAVVVVGPDTRSERNEHQVMAGPSYQGLFPKVAVLPSSVQHCIWMIPVPVIYPRLETAEQIAHTVATGKKAVTGTFNMLGRVTSSVAGVVGAKGVVGEGFSSIKKAVGKSGLMSGILSPFGDIDMLDELRDMWTHESKDLERTYIIRTLQGISHNKSLRMTFLSGSVNACGAGLVHDPQHPSDHKTMYQLIASAVVNAPPPGYVLRLLNNNNKPIYIPQNGHRSHYGSGGQGMQPTDTKEDMMEIFTADVNGAPREQKRLMGRRNYVALVAYDPEVVQGTFGQVTPSVPGMGKESGRLSLAADFMVQNEGSYQVAVKYGPVVVPSLEYGR